MTPSNSTSGTQDRAAEIGEGHYDGRGFVHGKGCDRKEHVAESCREHMDPRPRTTGDRAAPATEAAEPRTEAGRYLLDHFGPAPAPDAQELHRRSAEGRRTKLRAAIVTIEQQAAASVTGEAAVPALDSDIENLRRLAEKASKGSWRLGEIIPGARIYDADAAYIAACSPDRILALLDRLERLEKALRSFTDGRQPLDPFTDLAARLTLPGDRDPAATREERVIRSGETIPAGWDVVRPGGPGWTVIAPRLSPADAAGDRDRREADYRDTLRRLSEFDAFVFNENIGGAPGQAGPRETEAGE